MAPVVAAFPILLLLLSAVGGAQVLPGAHGSTVEQAGQQRLERRATKASAKTYYTSLVAFGASYTDNAHARSSQYSSSLRKYYPYNNAGGRYSNGPVAVEYMVSTSIATPLRRSGVAITLLDYAYGGSQIDNSLTFGSSPATKDQVAQFISDLSSGTAAIGAGRVLFYINSGINPLTQIWTTAINAGSSSSAVATAKQQVTANSAAIASQMRSINSNAGVYANAHGIDFMIVGLPALEIVPSFSSQCSGDARKLALLKALTAQFNSELKSFAASFKSINGKVFFFDLASLWYSLHSSPLSYGISVSPVTTTCYNSASGGVCVNPAQYLYFDSLHPVTSVHQVMANKINGVVNSG